jgi:hypothetical protein
LVLCESTWICYFRVKIISCQLVNLFTKVK